MSNLKQIKKYLRTFLKTIPVVLLLCLVMVPVAGDDSKEMARMEELRKEIKLLKSDLSALEKKINKVESRIDSLSEDRAKLKKNYKDNPSAINESKLNKILSDLREQIEAKNKLELDKEMKSESLESKNRELIDLINIRINRLLEEIKELESGDDLILIDRKITQVLLFQEEKKSLYGELENTYPEIPDIKLKLNPEDTEEVLTGKLKFVQDQLMLLEITNEKLEENRTRLMSEYKILQLLMDFYPTDSPRKDEMFDQLEIISIQIEELDQKIKQNNEKISELKELEEKLIERLNNIGG